MPGRRHPDWDSEGDRRKDKRCGPHSGAVDASDRDEFVDEENNNQDAEAGHGSSSGRKSDAGPWKAAEGGGDQTHGRDQDETLVRIRSAPGAPSSIDDNGEGDDADQWDGSGNGGIERADHHSTMQRVDGSDHAEHDHDRRQAEGDGAEGSMPFDAASGDKGDLHDEYQHPEGEDRAMDVKDGAGKRRAHHAGLEVSRREADEDADAEQGRHAAVEAAFRGSIDRSVGGLLA